MSESVTESQFYMWRTLFAMAHADHVVTNEEIRFMVEALEDIPFSDQQQRILSDDIAEPRDIVEMFEKISDKKDQAEFFKFARTLVWADGDYGPEEQAIMLKLKQVHIQNTNVDDLIGTIDMEFSESDALGVGYDPDADEKEDLDVPQVMFSFRDFFLNKSRPR